MKRWISAPLTVCQQILLLLFFLSAGLVGERTAIAAETEVAPIRLFSILNSDDQGERIGHPQKVFYDRWTEETYLVSSTGRITIYDRKYFPVASFGAGRGLRDPRGIAVDRQGTIYICDKASQPGDSARLLLYSQAFFPIREIVFDQIPELLGFSAGSVAVAATGEIYLSGERGGVPLRWAVVLGPDGEYRRVLQPGEKDSWQPLPETVPEQPTPTDPEDTADGEPGDQQFPDQLRPAQRKRPGDSGERQARNQRYPAEIVDVEIDRDGRIYLLSREASHVYVYDADERYLFKLGVKGGAEGKLSTPMSLAVDVSRRVIYVCDYMRHTILVYDYDGGRFIFEFGGRGFTPLWFNFPNSVAADSQGRVIVSDLFNLRVQVIDPNMTERRVAQGLPPTGLAPAIRPEPAEIPAADDGVEPGATADPIWSNNTNVAVGSVTGSPPMPDSSLPSGSFPAEQVGREEAVLAETDALAAERETAPGVEPVAVAPALDSTLPMPAGLGATPLAAVAVAVTPPTPAPPGQTAVWGDSSVATEEEAPVALSPTLVAPTSAIGSLESAPPMTAPLGQRANSGDTSVVPVEDLATSAPAPVVTVPAVASEAPTPAIAPGASTLAIGGSLAPAPIASATPTVASLGQMVESGDTLAAVEESSVVSSPTPIALASSTAAPLEQMAELDNTLATVEESSVAATVIAPAPTSEPLPGQISESVDASVAAVDEPQTPASAPTAPTSPPVAPPRQMAESGDTLVPVEESPVAAVPALVPIASALPAATPTGPIPKSGGVSVAPPEAPLVAVEEATIVASPIPAAPTPVLIAPAPATAAPLGQITDSGDSPVTVEKVPAMPTLAPVASASPTEAPLRQMAKSGNSPVAPVEESPVVPTAITPAPPKESPLVAAEDEPSVVASPALVVSVPTPTPTAQASPTAAPSEQISESGDASVTPAKKSSSASVLSLAPVAVAPPTAALAGQTDKKGDSSVAVEEEAPAAASPALAPAPIAPTSPPAATSEQIAESGDSAAPQGPMTESGGSPAAAVEEPPSASNPAPSALGVYGPVMTLLLYGNWLLSSR